MFKRQLHGVLHSVPGLVVLRVGLHQTLVAVAKIGQIVHRADKQALAILSETSSVAAILPIVMQRVPGDVVPGGVAMTHGLPVRDAHTAIDPRHTLLNVRPPVLLFDDLCPRWDAVRERGIEEQTVCR